MEIWLISFTSSVWLANSMYVLVHWPDQH